MTAAPQSPPGALVDFNGQPLRQPRLLVVDDQPVNVQALYQTFAADHQVLMATNGEQALALCRSRQPDLVLLDVVMAGMDGLTVCRRLKADPATCDIPVIFVTAQDDERDETSGLEAGAVDFISKPINPAVVRARVKTHLTLKSQADLLRHWVYIDGLTGVFNRRHFDERLAMEWSRSTRLDKPLSVVLLDVDHFKRFNDRYGHQAGDDVLRQVAAALKSALRRPTDMVARYGGEEFVCLLPDTELDSALLLARQIGRAVQDCRIEHAEAPGGVLTVSLGLCTRSGVAATGSPAALLGGADAQLYAAKASGRNQAHAAPLQPA